MNVNLPIAPAFEFTKMIESIENKTGKLFVGNEEKEIKDLTKELAKHKFELEKGKRLNGERNIKSVITGDMNRREINCFNDIFSVSSFIIGIAFAIFCFGAAIGSIALASTVASAVMFFPVFLFAGIFLPAIVGPLTALLPAGAAYLGCKMRIKIEDKKIFQELLKKEVSPNDGLIILSNIHNKNKKLENFSVELIDEQIDQMIQSINYIDQFRNELLDEELTQLDQLKVYYAVYLSAKNLNQDPAKNEIISALLNLNNGVSVNRIRELVDQMMACPHSILLKSPLFFDALKSINGLSHLENKLYEFSDKLFINLDEVKKEIMIRNMKFVLIKDDGLANEEYWSNYIDNIDLSISDKLKLPEIIRNKMIKNAEIFNASKKN
jgi:hypothetical protein